MLAHPTMRARFPRAEGAKVLKERKKVPNGWVPGLATGPATGPKVMRRYALRLCLPGRGGHAIGVKAPPSTEEGR
jgi:hypothetical protein